MASDKCHELARNLYAMSTRIPFEDVQLVAIQIIQCTSNVLTVGMWSSRIDMNGLLQSVNAPLQSRATILDLDNTRANQFPADYDTDLESPWANPSK